MKLYDYSKKRSKSKDTQFDQLDEEIRRIWDVLYNKREQYPNQVSNLNNSVIHPKYKQIFGANFSFSAETNPHAIAIDTWGCGGTITANSVASVPAWEVSGTNESPYGPAATTAAANSVNRMQLFRAATSNLGLYSLAHNPYYCIVAKTASTIANVNFYLMHTIDPGTGLTGATDTPNDNSIGVIYEPAGTLVANSTQWNFFIVTNAGVFSSLETGITVATDTLYIIEIDIQSNYGGLDAHLVTIRINGVITNQGIIGDIGFLTTAPLNTAFLQPAIVVKTKTAAQRMLKLSRVYCEVGGGLT